MSSFDWIPLEYRCVVKLDPVEEVTTGGIILPTKTQEREGMAQVYGTIVDMSEMSFTDIDGGRWKCATPSIGDRVMIAKYSGLVHKKKEGEKETEYRIINDKDIVAFKRGEDK